MRVAWEIVKDMIDLCPDLWTKEEIKRCKRICKRHEPQEAYDYLMSASSAFRQSWAKYCVLTLPVELRGNYGN